MTRPRPAQALWSWLVHKTCLDLVQRDLELQAATFPRIHSTKGLT